MLDPATARLCVWRLPLEAAFRLFSKLGSLGGSIRERFSRTGRTRPALARPAFSRWLLENDRLRERWPCQWLNVLYFPFSETSPSRGVDVPKALILGGYGFIATNGFGTKCSEYTDAACGAKARQLANSPHRLLNYFQMLVQGLSMSLS